MDIRVKAWLFDILNAINEIQLFIGGTPNFSDYQSDLKTRRAVERNLEIVGESMRRILNQDESTRLSHSRKIVDTRNRIIHGYDSVSDEMLWGIIINHLPSLKQEVEQLLGGE